MHLKETKLERGDGYGCLSPCGLAHPGGSWTSGAPRMHGSEGYDPYFPWMSAATLLEVAEPPACHLARTTAFGPFKIKKASSSSSFSAANSA